MQIYKREQAIQGGENQLINLTHESVTTLPNFLMNKWYFFYFNLQEYTPSKLCFTKRKP